MRAFRRMFRPASERYKQGVGGATVLPTTTTPELELSSVFEPDSRTRHHFNWFYRLKSKRLRAAHEEFNSSQQTPSILLSLNIILTLLSLPFLAVAGLRDATSPWIAATTGIVLANVFVWAVYAYARRVANQNDGMLPAKTKRLVSVYHIAIFFVLNTVLCLRLVGKMLRGACEAHSDLESDWNCNPVAEAHSLPGGPAMACMLLPVLYVVTTKGAHFELALCLWAETFCALVFSVTYSNATNSLLSVVYYLCGSLGIILQLRELNFFMFFMQLKLQRTLVEHEKATDAANAEEMRHMIANVAHDLKTPLSSFLSGIEYIAQEITDICAKKIGGAELSLCDVDEFVSSIGQCVTNMRNTNAFMLMTINRCIDYTKASKGVKLVPKFETIELQETLNLPLNCMKDIQQRVVIVLEPLRRGICSHIITDKQWLQENVLCLLSNAVKYSNGGEVMITVQKVKIDSRDLKIRAEERARALEEVQQSEKIRKGGKSTMRDVQSYRMGRVLPGDSSDSDINSLSFRGAGSMRGTTRGSGRGARVKRDDDENSRRLIDYLRVEVEDHGIGLSEEAMATLFNPFKQAQRLAGGTGLGLFSLARRVEALDGLCGVMRRRDGQEGSLFWFEIPYRPDNQSSKLMSKYMNSVRRGVSYNFPTQLADDGSQGSAVHPAPSPGAGSMRIATQGNSSMRIAIQSNSSMRIAALKTVNSGGNLADGTAPPVEPAPLDILLVDDSPAILKMTSMMLRRHKHQVQTATNGAEALKMVMGRIQELGKGFDVVLMDLQMPVMDGLEATRRLRAMELRGSVSTKRSPSSAAATAAADDTPNSAGTRDLALVAVESLTMSDKSFPKARNVIIGVSANSDAETAAEACTMGVDAFMAKPFSLETFYRTYDRIVLELKA